MVGREEVKNFVDVFAVFLCSDGRFLRLVEIFFKSSGYEAIITGRPSFSIPRDGVIGGIKEADLIPEKSTVRVVAPACRLVGV